MPDRQPPSNGFDWVARTILHSDRVEILLQRLGDLRHDATTRDLSELGRGEVTEVELLAHPDDLGRAGAILQSLLGA